MADIVTLEFIPGLCAAPFHFFMAIYEIQIGLSVAMRMLHTCRFKQKGGCLYNAGIFVQGIFGR